MNADHKSNNISVTNPACYFVSPETQVVAEGSYASLRIAVGKLFLKKSLIGYIILYVQSYYRQMNRKYIRLVSLYLLLNYF